MADTCSQTNVFPEFLDSSSYFRGTPPLSQGWGYGIVVGFGVAFSLLTTLLMYIERRFGSHRALSSEDFNTAGRSIKTGLTASNVVSQWTWAATLLQSSNVAFEYGVSGPFWYAAGATIQVLLFGTLAIQVKRKAPKAHTFLEIVRARWGTTAHLVFMYFALLTNIIVTAMLLLGGASVTNALTGMDINAASFLIPWGVIAYTMSGGLKAAFLAAYIHVVFLMVILCIFCFAIYAGPAKNVGSIDNMYELLKKTSATTDCRYGASCEYTLTACGAVDGNKHGSYLTMMSREGLIFGIINIVGNFGTVFLDQAYWQAAIAAKPQAAHKGYLLGGITWFSIPFTLATSLGLASVALQLPLSSAEAGAGLVPAATAVHIFGTAGGVLILIMLFMAVTASGSHEMIAVSSIITYDIYRTYFNPEATGAQVLRFSQYAVLGFGTFSGLLSIILHQIGLSLGWVYLFMGIAIGSGVVPIALLVNWKGISAKAAICGAFGGQALAVMAWLVTCSSLYTDITVDTLGMNYPMLAGNCVAILSSAAICVTMSLIWPQNYDWVSMQNISMIEKNVSWLNEDYNEAALSHSCRWIMKYGFCFSFTMVILVPLICIPIGVFNKGFFHVWVIVSLIWGLAATLYLTFAPLAEAWGDLVNVILGLFCGKSTTKTISDADFEKPAPSTEMAPQTAGLTH